MGAGLLNVLISDRCGEDVNRSAFGSSNPVCCRGVVEISDFSRTLTRIRSKHISDTVDDMVGLHICNDLDAQPMSGCMNEQEG